MAKIYPQDILTQGKIPQELKFIVSDLMKLDDSFHVFHYSFWGGKEDGDCDFIIFCQSRGFITLEVIIGRAFFDGKKWFCTSRDSKFRDINDPVKRAQDSMRALKRFYELKFNSSFAGLYNWCVVFMELQRTEEFKLLDIHESHIFEPHKGSIAQWVDSLFVLTEDAYGQKILSSSENQNFLSLFSIDLRIPFAYHRLKLERQRKLVTTDLLQENLLDLFEDKERIAFKGSAGTGKTWLGMKKAARLATQGKKVLFICNSRALCQFVAQKLEFYPQIDVMTFYSFANTLVRDYLSWFLRDEIYKDYFFECLSQLLLAGGESAYFITQKKTRAVKNLDLHINAALFSLSNLKAGYDYDSVIEKYEKILPLEIIDILYLFVPDGSAEDDFFDYRLVLALSLVIESGHISLKKHEYDAVIIDEGEDFRISWCDILQNLFIKYKNKAVYVFYDENETIYRKEKELPIKRLIYKSDHNNYIFNLDKNIRCCDEIHKFGLDMTGLGYNTRSLRLSGISPFELDFDSNNDFFIFLERLLEELVFSYKIPEDNIVILSNRSISNSVFALKKNIGKFYIAESDNIHKPFEVSINFRTIREFKGMESDVVIIVFHKRDVEFMNKNQYLSEELLYCGITRATSLLYMLTVTS